MKKTIFSAKAVLNEFEPGKAPKKMLLFQEGWGELEKDGRFLIDRQSFDAIAGNVARRGNDVVFDYEHQSIKDMQAPAAGWIKNVSYEDGVGIMAGVEWTDTAADYLEKKEYRYFSPVFEVRKSDSRVIGIHSVALTNTPKTNNLTPILAKLELDNFYKEELNMDFFKTLFAKLGLKAGASEDDVITAVAKLQEKEPETKEVIPGQVIDALDLKEGDNVSTVIASINVLKQNDKSAVSRTEFEALQKKLAEKDADEIVAKAMAEGKITPDQKDWADDYAAKDLEGFMLFVAKAAVVVPINKLLDKKNAENPASLDETTLAVAKMFGNTEEDLKLNA